MISAEGVSHSFDGAEVLTEVSLSAHRGEVVGLIGPNGSGKTTLLRSLYRGLTPDAGAVLVDDRTIGAYRPRELARSVSVVTQESHGELPLTVVDVVALGRGPHLGPLQRVSNADLAIVSESLRRVGAEHLADRDLTELSGGERQRVLIARALAQQATHLLMDEPTNHLDIRYQHEVLGLVRELGVTTVVVLHDLNLAARYCDRLLLLSHGRVIATGPVDEVLDPGVLESVYGVRVESVRADDGYLQLLFGAGSGAGAQAPTASAAQGARLSPRR